MFIKKSRWISTLLILVLVLVPFGQIYGATDVMVDITKDEPLVVLSDEGERIFDIGYNFNVDFEATATGVDLVLVLDRSNSMLRLDPSTNLPVADAVWQAVNEFVTSFYTVYPDSNVGVVSFGSEGDKSDSWNFYSNAADTLEEVANVYDYRDLYTDYSYDFRAYWNNGYRYAWEHWYISEGATNIRAAFEYARATVQNKVATNEVSEQNIVLLFTDGVATQGGSYSQLNYNYPTAHNTNTIAAYEAGIAAQVDAEIITVGYFEGIQYESTATVARETLRWSQNAGFFEAGQTSELTGIFGTIVEKLNFAGTDAMVTEIVESEFEVVPDSIEPEAYSVTTDDNGRTVVKWQLGNVIASDYNFGYQVKVKDDVYPTGSGTIKIPINLDAELTYTDLNGNAVIEYLGHNETTIPPRANQPLVNVDVVYADGYGYLVGDPIRMTHDMSFTNDAPFDYREILVRNLTKTINGGDFGTELALTEDSETNGWTVNGDNLVYDIQAFKAVTDDQNLEWTDEIGLTLVSMSAGTYSLGCSVDYRLINSAALEFDFTNAEYDPGTVTVKEGILRLNLIDDYGDPITNADVVVDGSAMTSVLEGDQIVVSGITSGSHNITFQVPSGYHFDGNNTSVVIVEDDVAFTGSFDFNNPELVKDIGFTRLNVRNVTVTDRLGASVSAIDQVTDNTEAIVTFELVRGLEKVSLRLTDDYGPTNHHFTLDQADGYGVVVGPSGKVNGFTMVDSSLQYDGDELQGGVYSAYGVIAPPAGLGNDIDFDYEVYVDQLTTRGPADTNDTVLSLTSSELLIGLQDDEPPVIVSELDGENTTINVASYDVNITDKVKIVEVQVYLGSLTLEEILSDSKLVDFTVDEDVRWVQDIGWVQDISTDVELLIEMVEGKFIAKGSITIYARDAFGNEEVHLIVVENEDINGLFDSDIK